MPLDVGQSAVGWAARLELGFRRTGARTVLAHRRHVGPLVVQKALYPEGEALCHAVLVHPPGGIAGGDRLGLYVTVGDNAHAVLTTPAATKWYRADGRPAQQLTHFAVDNGAALEYLPQETIIFDGALTRIETTVDLGESGTYAGWDIVCLGRRASGETFRYGHLHQRLTIRRGQHLLWHEAASIAGSDPMLASPVGLSGASVFAALVVAAGSAPADVIAAARAVLPRDGLRWGITAPPGIVSARYLGHHAEAARDWFAGLWEILRPWYAGLAAVRPRLWST